MPWGKLFKAAKVAIKTVGVGKRLVEGCPRLRTAQKALSDIPEAGGGDAFVAGEIAARLRGEDPDTAGWWGSAAAALTVTHLGGRPDLDPARVEATARDARREHGGS
ncbi:PfkB family carbohydrate kinase [Cellulomonas cellasea]|uniref:Carbohydrate kinase PfkB domain-containing protein n=2 Tax=Cellulomonas cellasea TaxID=43670 RepID=A0A0A0BAM7_9CELL|nr:hypothetical protein Q760_08680 [Cellulomonas cellasea DSM 20118]GEA89779.1 hypothetical protein CCE01nite_37280 [Cellulomonas cellasea]